MSASRRREGRTTGNSRRRTRGGRSPVPPRPQGAARCAWPCPCRSRRRPRRPACRARPCRPRERRRRCPIQGRTRPPSSSSSSSSSRRGHRGRVCATRPAVPRFSCTSRAEQHYAARVFLVQCARGRASTGSITRHSRLPHPPSPVASLSYFSSRLVSSPITEPRALFALHPLPRAPLTRRMR